MKYHIIQPDQANLESDVQIVYSGINSIIPEEATEEEFKEVLDREISYFLNEIKKQQKPGKIQILGEEFVRNNPKLIKYVKNNEMTWQKFYEIYDIYGDEADVWKKYLSSDCEEKVINSATSSIGFTDFIYWLKTVNLDGLQEGIDNVQRVLGIFQDFAKKDNSFKENEYKPRPIYKNFED